MEKVRQNLLQQLEARKAALAAASRGQQAPYWQAAPHGQLGAYGGGYGMAAGQVCVVLGGL